jgi:predicted nucleic acid-binding protein
MGAAQRIQLPSCGSRQGLATFAGLPRVSVANPEAAAIVPDWAERGLDFADARHLAAAQGHDGFVSFDKALARTAHRLGAPAVREP